MFYFPIILFYKQDCMWNIKSNNLQSGLIPSDLETFATQRINLIFYFVDSLIWLKIWIDIFHNRRRKKNVYNSFFLSQEMLSFEEAL